MEPIWPTGFRQDYSDAEFARIKAHYAGECSHVDKWCGYVLDTLEEQGLLDDTLVVFTSDHGCMMGEQGEIHKGADRVRIQVTRCPLIIRRPDQAHAGTVVEGFVQHHDLMPSLLSFLGEPAPERCNGEDFWPLITGERTGGLRDTVVSGFGSYAAVRTADWMYHAPWAPIAAGRARPPELYDRRSDPEELVNVIDRYPEVAQALRAYLERLTAGFDSDMGQATDTPAAVPGVKW